MERRRASAHYLGALLRYDETGGDGWPVVGEKTVGAMRQQEF